MISVLQIHFADVFGVEFVLEQDAKVVVVEFEVEFVAVGFFDGIQRHGGELWACEKGRRQRRRRHLGAVGGR